MAADPPGLPDPPGPTATRPRVVQPFIIWRFAMKVRPLRDRILVQRVEESEQRIGGVIIPHTAQEKTPNAKDVALGNGRVNDQSDIFPPDVKAGEDGLLGKYARTHVQ